MDNEMNSPDFDIIDVPIEDLSDEEKEVVDEHITAIGLAGRLMETYEPSFAVVGHPHLRMTTRGFVYPVEIGLSINANLSLTKSGMAAILREIASMLDEDINKVITFVHEATGKDEDA